MSSIFTVLLFVVFIAVVASLYTEGMWGNAIRLVDVVTSALVATNYFEPLAKWIGGMGDWFKSLDYAWDFLCLWALFAISMIVLRGLTDSVCKVKVRFLKIADQIGSVAFACLVAWAMVSFATFTMHTAPLSKNFLFGGFQSDSKMMLGLAPDQRWLTFARMVSRGSFSRSPAVVFDQRGEFVNTYEARRDEIEDHVKSTQTIRKN